MAHQQRDDPDRRSDVLTAHLVKSEALRAAEAARKQGSSLEAVLARVSAQVTADAAARKFLAEKAPGHLASPEPPHGLAG